MKILQIELHSTNLLLWPPIWRNKLLNHLIYIYLTSPISIEFITQNISSWASRTTQIGSGEVKFITTRALAVFFKILIDFWRRSWIKHFTRRTEKHGRFRSQEIRILTAELKLKHCERMKLHRCKCILKIWASTYRASLFLFMDWGKIVKPSMKLLRNINMWKNKMNWLTPIFLLA